MRKVKNIFAWVLIVGIVLSSVNLLVVKPANAQSIPKPSVPEFTLRYVENIDNQSIEVVIHDQLPAKYSMGDGVGTAFLYYNVQWKNQSENSWHIYSPNFYYIQPDNLAMN